MITRRMPEIILAVVCWVLMLFERLLVWSVMDGDQRGAQRAVIVARWGYLLLDSVEAMTRMFVHSVSRSCDHPHAQKSVAN